MHDLPDLGFRGGEEAIIEWTMSRVHARDLQLDAHAVEGLAARVGLDTMQLEQELEKLETAFGKAHPISSDDIRMLVPQTREGGIFDLRRGDRATEPAASVGDAGPADAPGRAGRGHPAGGNRADGAEPAAGERPDGAA